MMMMQSKNGIAVPHTIKPPISFEEGEIGGAVSGQRDHCRADA